MSREKIFARDEGAVEILNNANLYVIVGSPRLGDIESDGFPSFPGIVSPGQRYLYVTEGQVIHTICPNAQLNQRALQGKNSVKTFSYSHH